MDSPFKNTLETGITLPLSLLKVALHTFGTRLTFLLHCKPLKDKERNVFLVHVKHKDRGHILCVS
jgi:hypothetical protein